MSKPISPEDVLYLHSSSAIQNLEGQILTLIEATVSDSVQRKAIKDLARPMIWKWAIENSQEPIK